MMIPQSIEGLEEEPDIELFIKGQSDPYTGVAIPV
jgi:hypothetical protein